MQHSASMAFKVCLHTSWENTLDTKQSSPMTFMALCDEELNVLSLLLERGLDYMASRGPFWPKPFCVSYKESVLPSYHKQICQVSLMWVPHSTENTAQICGGEQELPWLGEWHTETAWCSGTARLGTASPLRPASGSGSSLDKMMLLMAGWKGKLHN